MRREQRRAWHDVATLDMIRQLPAGFALLIRGGCAPVIAALPRGWYNPAYKKARRRGQATAALTPALAPAATAVPAPEPVIPGRVPARPAGGDGASFPWS